MSPLPPRSVVSSLWARAQNGWPEDIATDEALQRLLALNLERAAAQRKSGDEGEAG